MSIPVLILCFILLAVIAISMMMIKQYRLNLKKLKTRIETSGSELSDLKSKLASFEKDFTFHLDEKTEVIKREYEEKRDRDIVLKKALKKAEDANFLLNSFLSNVSSEIRTPLNNIIGFANLLEAELSMMENKELFDYAHAVSESGDRLLHLLNNIIDISRVESNDFTLKPGPLAVNAAIANIIQVFLFQANERKLKLNFRPGDIPEIMADNNGLSKVLGIILENSIKYTDRGFINVSTEFLEERNLASIRIKDTGRGIDPAFIPELLEPFKNETTGFSKESKGSGLGLPLAKSLMEMMRGELEIQSEKGVGTTVTLLFPIVSGDAVKGPAPSGPHPKKKIRTLQNLDIFIVEDDMMNKLVLVEMTKSFGSVIAAMNGDETMEIINRKAGEGKFFDIMLFDINLPPPWDGIKLMQEIRHKWKEYRSIPFIAQTAYAMVGDREKLLEAGFDDYIPKPINQQQLYSIMKNQLNK